MKRLIGVFFLLVIICAAIFGLASLDTNDLAKAKQAATKVSSGNLIPPAPSQLLLGTSIDPQKMASRRLEDIAVNTVPSLVHIRSLVGSYKLIQNVEKISDFYSSLGINLEHQGTGIFLNDQGLILTPLHTVLAASAIQVRTWDGKMLMADIVSADVGTDLAILKIPLSGTRPIKWGDSSSLSLGEQLVLIGSDTTGSGRISQGIVSSKVRSLVLPDEGFYGQIFSVDSPSSTIQSGWPALNLNGQVVGILGQASTHLYLSEDEKVVLSSNQLQQITEILAQGKTIERGYLGLQLQPITADLATALRLSSADGALVSEVMAGSPAEVAGLLAGDIIKKLDQQMVKRHEQIRLIISELRIGKAITMEIERKGQTQSMSVIPLAHPLQFAVELNQEAQKFYTLDASQRSPLDGVEVTEFKEKALSKIRATELNQFMINRIDYQQTLASAPIEPGTFLLEIDGEKFSTLQEFTALHLKTQGRKVVVLRIESRGKKSYVTLKNNL